MRGAEDGAPGGTASGGFRREKQLTTPGDSSKPPAMKRLLPLAAALAFAVSAFPAAAASAVSGAPPLVLAIMPELPPYAFLDPDTGELRGIDLAIVRAAADRLGRPLSVRRVSFAEMLPSVKDGTADFAAGAITINSGRSRDADFSLPYAEEGAAFLYRAGEPPPTMISAESLRVGVVESMTHDFYLTRHGIEPVRFSSIAEAAAAFRAREIDTVFYDSPALAVAARASGGTLAVTPLETRERYGIAVRKGRADLLEAVNAVIREGVPRAAEDAAATARVSALHFREVAE
jgi:ABC-type amino acid transport substrate-binding protein